MIQKLTICANTELIFAKDECSYTDVVNDFDNANTIKIVTFNISCESTKLLNKISELTTNKNIDIITNIPNRYKSYYSGYARRKARNTINSYTEQLNPENFAGDVSSYFNFSNHSKIILTENIAYIGSANVSDESCNNYECGIITRNKNTIKGILDNVIPILKDDSVEYFGNDYSRITIVLMNLLTKLKRLQEEFHISFYNISGHRDIQIEYYDNWNAYLSPKTLDLIEECIYEYEEIKDELIEFNNFNFELLNSDFIESTIDIIYDNLRPFAEFDAKNRANTYIAQNPDAYDENLNDCVEDAAQQAFDEQSDMADEIQNKVIEFENRLRNLSDNIQYNFQIFYENRKVNDEVDNT